MTGFRKMRTPGLRGLTLAKAAIGGSRNWQCRRALTPAAETTRVRNGGRGLIVRLYGRTGRYLRLPSGEPTWKLLRMVPAGMGPGMRAAIDSACTTGKRVLADPFRVKRAGRSGEVSVEVAPLAAPEGLYFLVLFHEGRSRSLTMLRAAA